MTILSEERASDSPYVASITQGYTASAGTSIRPAEISWHMVLVREQGRFHALVVGPWAQSGVASWGAGAEILWIKFRLGTFMPHLPTREFLNGETLLPEAAGRSFWLKGSAWQFPDYENVDTFLNRLARQDILMSDPVVAAALQDAPSELPSRTVRHRFLRSTGLSQNTIRQMQRAQAAAALLRRGVSILDTVDEAGYFDQPHLTRALKHFIGYTPAQLLHLSDPACHSVQDRIVVSEYATSVLAEIR